MAWFCLARAGSDDPSRAFWNRVKQVGERKLYLERLLMLKPLCRSLRHLTQCIKTNDATLLFSLLFKFPESRDLLQFHRSPYYGLENAFTVCIGDWQPFQLVSPPASVKFLFGMHSKKTQCERECFS